MQATWTLAGLWLLQTAVGGSLVLLLALGWMRFIRQPARRQRLGELSLAAALLAALVALGPAWLTLPWSPFVAKETAQFALRLDQTPLATSDVEIEPIDLVRAQLAWDAQAI